MSLKPQEMHPIPEETIRVAHTAFPKGNAIMRIRDHLGPIYTDAQFTALFPHDGQPALSPGRLALVSVLQFAEGLSDRQAADAVRSRIEWKYALGLALDDPGFDASVLSEFRSRLVAGQAEKQLFETMITLLREHGFLKARGKQRTDSTHVLAAVVMLNRLECVGETLRHTLNVLATVAPDWLRAAIPAAWFERYTRRFEEYRLPQKKEERYAHEVRNEVVEELIRVRGVKATQNRRLRLQKRAATERCSAKQAERGEIGREISNRGHRIPLGEAGLSEKGGIPTALETNYAVAKPIQVAKLSGTPKSVIVTRLVGTQALRASRS